MEKLDTFSKWLDRIATQQDISEKKHLKMSHKRRVQKAKDEYRKKLYNIYSIKTTNENVK